MGLIRDVLKAGAIDISRSTMILISRLTSASVKTAAERVVKMTTDGPMTKLTPTELDAIRKRISKGFPEDIYALLAHIAVLEAELKAASDPENKYWQPTPGAECPHCKRVVGTFFGCSVGGCPCGEEM